MRRELALLAITSWSVGVFLYAAAGLLVSLRLMLYPFGPEELTPPYWVAMGALAITVLAGARIVEMAEASRLFADPRHPYTRSLIAAAPRPVASGRVPQVPLKGETASAMAPPPGCAFHPRCPFAQDHCRTDRPELRRVGDDLVACHFAESLPPMPKETAGDESPALARRLQVLAHARKEAA